MFRPYWVHLAAAACSVAMSTAGAEPGGRAVEYYNSILRHYFVTANSQEMAMLEGGGAGPGWSRTGGSFGVHLDAGEAPGVVPVCRFYGTPGSGPNSHFYTADAGECAFVKTTPGWTYEGIAFHIQVPSAGSCAAGTAPVYRTYNNGAARNDSNHRYTVDATVYANAAAAGHALEGVPMCAPLATADRDADAARLLRQATFGPREADLLRVRDMGAAAWVEEQLSLPVTAYTIRSWMPANRPDTCVDDRTQPVRPDSYCARDNYTLFPLQTEFFRHAGTQQDQLRGRVAFALSQIFVTSGVDNSRSYAMRDYQQMLRDRAFGNFYDLILAVTLSPVMGDYLDMANNNKSSATTGTDPNENYAREILQLFSVGTVKLNLDGTPRLDAAGAALPTYDLAEIKGFSRVFTGWTYPTVAGALSRGNNPRNYLGNMLGVVANHELGTKVLLDGVVAPANLTMDEDLAFAHRNIFNHPNVAPFISKQLIQKLVTSDPTPAYVGRVAAVFNNNGAGMRGDLRAVVRAILLDPEARGAVKIDPAYGKLTEPVVYMTAVLRALGGRTDGVSLRTTSNTLGQFVFYPSSVFNYYPPDHMLPGTSLLGPEFAIQNTSTTFARANFATALVLQPQIAPDSSVYGSTGTAVDLTAYQVVAADAGALADRLNTYLLAGRMTPAMRAAIVTAVNAVAATDLLGRARAAAWLVVTSPHFQVER